MSKENVVTTGLLTRLAEKYGPDITVGETQPIVYIAPARLLELLRYLKEDTDYQLDWLSNLTAVDYPAQVDVVYHLHSRMLNHKLTVKVKLEKSGEGTIPPVTSVVALWPGADYQEREVYDLMGVTFAGHPNLKRILLPEEFEGHPLQKSYKLPSRQENIARADELGSKVNVC